MAVGLEITCEGCPLSADDAPPMMGSRVCLHNFDYPLTLAEKGVVVEIESEADLPEKFSEFTEDVFSSVLKRPGTTLHPRAFLRATVNGKGHRRICPLSWPTPSKARLVIEQVAFDLGGMQPRLLYNDLPWISQPNIYCDCLSVISEAKRIADDWVDEVKKKSGGDVNHGGTQL